LAILFVLIRKIENIYMRCGAIIPSKASAFSKVNLNDNTKHSLALINSGISAFKTFTCS